MRTLLKIGLTLLMLSFVLIALAYNVIKSNGAAGPVAAAGRALSSETRKVDAMATAVALNGPIDLTLTQGPTPSLRVRGEQRSLANIDTRQDGRDLHIGTKGMLLNPRHRLQVELVLPQLDELVVRSSGSTRVRGFTGETMDLQAHGTGSVTFNGRYRKLAAGLHGSGALTLNAGSSDMVELLLEGSGHVSAAGSSKALEAALSGSGMLDARHLAADTVTLALKGSGTATVFARRSAALELRGSGEVTVYGNPGQRSVSRTGSGSVSWE